MWKRADGFSKSCPLFQVPHLENKLDRWRLSSTHSEPRHCSAHTNITEGISGSHTKPAAVTYSTWRWAETLPSLPETAARPSVQSVDADCVWNMMAHAQKPDFLFRAKRTSPFKSAGGGRQFSRLLAAEVCASAVVMLDTPCSEVVWRVLATHCI